MKVLLTRTGDGNRRTAGKLAALGFEAISLPLSGLGATGKSLPEGEYDGIIFTSASAVSTLPEGMSGRFAGKPAFCVGERTAAAAGDAGFSNIVTGSGDAEALAETIRSHFAGKPARLAYPAGTERAFDMSAALKGTGISLELAETYSMERFVPGTGQLKDALETADAAFFYSPASARHFTGLVRSAGLTGLLSGLAAIAISHKVAEELSVFGKVHVAQWPNESSMFDTLQRLEGGTS